MRTCLQLQYCSTCTAREGLSALLMRMGISVLLKQLQSLSNLSKVFAVQGLAIT